MLSRTFRLTKLPRSHTATRPCFRTYASAQNTNLDDIRIVEVGPRDGLQNEKTVIPPDVKIELINRLNKTGLRHIEVGSFVSPKWVPQMAGTAEILTKMERVPGSHYPVLVPNLKGLELLLQTLEENPVPEGAPPLTDEIAIFTAATDEFSKANTNCTVAESLTRLEAVTQKARDHGLRVRGYVSVIDTCPYSGEVDPARVRDVAHALLDMGCYEVSLGDTTGTLNWLKTGSLLASFRDTLPAHRLAMHLHDTFGQALANIATSISFGITTFDASVAGLGGCPYSPGATGNVATEDVLYFLQRPSQPENAPDLAALAEVGSWISQRLGRPNASRTGTALAARRERARLEKERERDGGAVESIAQAA